MLSRCLFAALLIITAPQASRGAGGDAYEAGGSLRHILALLDNYSYRPFFGDHGTDAFSQTLLRLTLEGRPAPSLAYEIHLVQALNYTSAGGAPAGTTAFAPSGSGTRYRALEESLNWWEGDKALATLWLDRCNGRISLPGADITLGRQGITFGKAYFWNPLDVFLPFDQRQFDRDYKPGVDAIRLDMPLGHFSGVTLVGAAGREPAADGSYGERDETISASWRGSALLGRLFFNLGGWDFSLQGGKVYGGYQLGGGASGEIGPLALRCEGAHFRPTPPDGDRALLEDKLSLVLGLGHRFENSLTLDGEYFFNGGGENRDLDSALARYRHGALLQLGRHLTGLTASYEFTPLLTGRLSALFSWSDRSCQIQPGLTLSLSDEAELLLGAILNRGKRPAEARPFLQSEFGSYPDLYYIEVKLYF